MSQRYIDTVNFGMVHFMTYLVESFGHLGRDLREIERKYKSKVKFYIWNWKCPVVVYRSSVLGIFSGPIPDAAVQGRFPQIRLRT